MDLDEIDENLTPQPKSAKIETSKIETPKREMAPPPVANVQLRAKLTRATISCQTATQHQQ